jgi:branched-chain amino acid transport system substrate-binding protein
VTQFLADYGAAYKDDTGNPKVPDALAALGYDAANMLFTAIQNAGVDDVDKVAEALDNISLVGVSGTITIDEFHNPVKDLTILAVKDGKVNFETVVKP